MSAADTSLPYSDEVRLNMRGAYLDTSYGRLHYREVGEGDPVLFLHGNRWDSNFWMRVAPLVGRRYRAIALDWPPNGLSEPPLEEPQELAHYTGLIAAFLDGLGLARIRLVGCHAGSAISVDVAATHPERIERLVLIGLPARLDEHGNVPPLSPTARATDQSYYYDPSRVDPATIARMEERLARFDPASDPGRYEVVLLSRILLGARQPWAYNAMNAYDIAGGMRRIVAPTLVLHFDGDAITEDLARNGLKYIEGSVWKQLHGDYHMPLSDPEPLASAILEFLHEPDTKGGAG